MKSLLFLAFVLSPSFVFGVSALCEKNQSAVDPKGVCMMFSSSCQVPDDWKRVPSCDLVKPIRGQQNDTLYERRFGENYWDQLKKKRKENLRKRASNRSRVGRLGRAAVVEEVKALNKDKPLSHELAGEKRKNTFQKRLSRNSVPEFYRQSLKRRGSVKNEDKLTEKEQLEAHREQWGDRRPPLERATEMDRASDFSSMPKWRVQKRTHFKERRYGRNPYWRRSTVERAPKRKRIVRTISNRRGYKGARLEGLLNGFVK